MFAIAVAAAIADASAVAVGFFSQSQDEANVDFGEVGWVQRSETLQSSAFSTPNPFDIFPFQVTKHDVLL